MVYGHSYTCHAGKYFGCFNYFCPLILYGFGHLHENPFQICSVSVYAIIQQFDVVLYFYHCNSIISIFLKIYIFNFNNFRNWKTSCSDLMEVLWYTRFLSLWQYAESVVPTDIFKLEKLHKWTYGIAYFANSLLIKVLELIYIFLKITRFIHWVVNDMDNWT